MDRGGNARSISKSATALRADFNPLSAIRNQGRVEDWRTNKTGLLLGVAHTQAVSRYQVVFPVPPHQTVHEVFPHTAFRQGSPVSIQPHTVASFPVIGTTHSPDTGLAESRASRVGVSGVPHSIASEAATIRIIQNAETSLLLGFGCPIKFPLQYPNVVHRVYSLTAITLFLLRQELSLK